MNPLFQPEESAYEYQAPGAIMAAGDEPTNSLLAKLSQNHVHGMPNIQQINIQVNHPAPTGIFDSYQPPISIQQLPVASTVVQAPLAAVTKAAKKLEGTGVNFKEMMNKGSIVSPMEPLKNNSAGYLLVEPENVQVPEDVQVQIEV